MPSEFQVRIIKRDDGQLYPVLLKAGLPLVLPNLWCEEVALGARFNTQKAYLEDVCRLYRWAEGTDIPFSERFRSLQGFTKPELRAMVQAMCTKDNGLPASNATCLRRQISITSFIEFAMDLAIDARLEEFEIRRDAEKLKERLIKRTRQLFAARKAAGAHNSPSTALTASELQVISTAIHPFSDINPFRGSALRFRNYCLFHVALETWARRAELALLEISDLELQSTPTILMKAPAISNTSKRRDGASMKTNERIAPISPELAALLNFYLSDFRDHFLRPRVPTTALFVSSRDGRRLSSSSINRIFTAIQNIPAVASLQKRLHPHGLRTSGANNFRRTFSNSLKSNRAQDGGLADNLRDCMTYLGGWAPGSAMVEKYSRAAIAERVAQLIHAKLESHE